jgi:hypothetical protein
VTTNAPNKLAALLADDKVAGLRRSDAGEVVPIYGADLAKQAVRDRRRMTGPGVSGVVAPASEPVHLLLRDAAAMVPQGFTRDLMQEIPRAYEVLRAYQERKIEGFEALQLADAQYVNALEDWGRKYVQSRRRDADTVYLHLETVHLMQRVLQVTYAMPTIGNAIPRDVLGTYLETWTQIIEEETEEIAQIGDSWNLNDAPTSEPARSEKSRRIKFFKAAAVWTDRELEIAQEVRRQALVAIGDMVQKKIQGAARSMVRTAAFIEAHGLHFDTLQIPGLLYGADAVRAGATDGIPYDEGDFADTSSPVNSVAQLNLLVRTQQQNVSYREDKVADTMAIDPAAWLALTQLVYNSANASNITAMDMFLARNPQIRQVIKVREFRHDSAAIAKLTAKGLSTAEATRCAGGFQETGGQMRSAVLLFRRDPALLALVTGRQLETRTFPPMRDKHEALMRQSSGGCVAYEPKTAIIGYRPSTGDPA